MPAASDLLFQFLRDRSHDLAEINLADEHPEPFSGAAQWLLASVLQKATPLGNLEIYEAAHSMVTRLKSFSSLKRWAMAVGKRRGLGRATVALAKKLAIILHCMRANGTDFRFGKEEAAAA